MQNKMRVLCYGTDGLVAKLKVRTMAEAQYQARRWNRTAPAGLVISIFLVDPRDIFP